MKNQITSSQQEKIIKMVMEQLSIQFDDATQHLDIVEAMTRTFWDAQERDGFIYNLEDIAKWIGYRKDNAKVLITKSGRENIDYKVSKNNVSLTPKISLLTSQERKTQGENQTHGGQNKELIMLTPSGLGHILQQAKPNDPIKRERMYFVRTAVNLIFRGSVKFLNAIQNEELEVTRKRKNTKMVSHSNKRIRSAKSTNELNSLIQAEGPADGGIYPRIAGMTNKAVLGMYKYELAKHLNKPAKRVNARDHMTRSQLSATEFIQSLTRDKLERGEGEKDFENVHDETCKFFSQVYGKELHGKYNKEKLTLPKARRTLDPPKIKDKPTQKKTEQKRTLNSITKYMTRK